jgi:hypothetical protein
MNLIKHAAMISLVSFLPIAFGCSSSGNANGADEASPADQATEGAALSVVGKAGATKRPFTTEEIQGVIGNTTMFTVDGALTSDFAKVLTAQKVEIDKGNGEKATLLRDGNRLELQGSAAGVAVEIDGAKFTIVSDKGRWECLLTGLDDASQSKLAGAMTLGVLLALDQDLAAQAEEGRCEVACVAVIAFAIVVGVGILAATAAFIVCETTGQDRCERLARNRCTNGARSVTKVCDAIGAAAGVFKNGRIEFKGSCRIVCR